MSSAEGIGRVREGGREGVHSRVSGGRGLHGQAAAAAGQLPEEINTESTLDVDVWMLNNALWDKSSVIVVLAFKAEPF